jgi:hypothetical protein
VPSTSTISPTAPPTISRTFIDAPLEQSNAVAIIIVGK